MPTFPSRLLHRSSPIAMIAAVLAAAACSSSSGTGTGGGGASSSAAGSTSGTGASSSASTGTGGSPMVCPGMGFGSTDTPVVGGSVTATIVDEKGMAVVGQPVFICGTDICSNPGMTDGTGKVTITTNLMMKKPAFKFGDAVAYAELAIPLTTPAITFPMVGTGKFPATGVAFAPDTAVTSGSVTVFVPKGGSAVVNELIYDTPEKQKLRAVQIPIANEAPVLAPLSLGFEVLYGVAPAGTLLCPAAKVTVPNSAQWAAGAAVEFWVMTVDVGQEFAPYGGWAKASDGTVSADGKTVATDDGLGFIYLDNFGVRLKP